MKSTTYQIGHIPVILYGEPCKKGYLFIHGQGGCKEEAASFAETATVLGYQVLSIDLPQHGERINCKDGFDPWTIVPELQTVLCERKAYWHQIGIRANSIGAYFALLAFQNEGIFQALFVSLIINMEQLILDMMKWSNVTEDELHKQTEIATAFGQTLSWPYLSWVRQHPMDAWKSPLSILYAGGDTLTSLAAIIGFSKAHNAELTVYKEGEHWFHSAEQLAYLRTWEQKSILFR